MIHGFIPNDQIRKYFSKSKIVLNDHWQENEGLGIHIEKGP